MLKGIILNCSTLHYSYTSVASAPPPDLSHNKILRKCCHKQKRQTPYLHLYEILMFLWSVFMYPGPILLNYLLFTARICCALDTIDIKWKSSEIYYLDKRFKLVNPFCGIWFISYFWSKYNINIENVKILGNILSKKIIT